MARPKGSTVCITVMFTGWVAYVVGCAWFYMHNGQWLPMELTVGTIGLFLVETVSLARLKMAKEGYTVKPRKVSPVASKYGLDKLPDFEEEVQEVQGNEGETDKPQVPSGPGRVSG